MPQPAHQSRCLVTAVPGPRSCALRAREDAHLAPGAQGYAVLAGVVVDHAEGTQITDADGNQLLDFIGGIAVGALGHSHPTWVEVIRNQAGRAAVPGSHQVPYADGYRCPLGACYPSCGIACAEVARKYAKIATAGAVAGIIVEPMQATDEATARNGLAILGEVFDLVAREGWWKA